MTTDTTASTAANDSKDASADASRQGPGRLIRLARERARLQVSELANLTKLAPSTLEALERDDFNVLNEPVYVRGYYRKCAKALVINEQELIAAYERLVAPKAPQAPTKLLIGGGEGRTSLKSSSRGGMRWLWLVVVGALIGAVLWFLHEDPNARHALSSSAAEVSNLNKPSLAAPAEPAPAAAPAASSAPAAAPAATAAARPSSPNELSTTPADSGQSQAAAETPPADTAPTPAHASPGSSLTMSESVSPAAQAPQAAATASAPPAAAGPQSLTLDFKGTSWVRIEDSTGKVLVSGVIQSGEHQVISGKPPYSVFFGNAPGVSLSYQGQPLDLQPYIKSNATARLTVPAGQ